MRLEEQIAETRREIRHSPLEWEDGNTAQDEAYENGYDFGFNDGLGALMRLLQQGPTVTVRQKETGEQYWSGSVPDESPGVYALVLIGDSTAEE